MQKFMNQLGESTTSGELKFTESATARSTGYFSKMADKPRVAVIGAGPVGLASAVNIQERIPGVDITLIAEKFSPHTTGDCAAGLVIPYTLGNTPKADIRRWMEGTVEHCKKLFRSDEAARCGVSQMPGYLLFTHKQPDPDWTDCLTSFRHASTEEVEAYCGQYETAWYIVSWLIECSLYLPWLLAKDYDIVVNCTGVGACDLGDSGVNAARGQIVRVRAPWVRSFVIYNTSENYIIPGQEVVTLGGTYQPGDWSTTPRDTDRQHCINGCSRMLPALKGAPVVSEWVGHRPLRDCVRLQLEDINYDSKNVKVVHNYGHGGAGVGLHWGCATHAADLVEQALYQLDKTASKL